MLTGLGHRVSITTGVPHAGYDVLVAVHAFKTAAAVSWSRQAHPERPIVVALTGTDLSRDIHVRDEARRSIDLADRLVVLHDMAFRELPRKVRSKARLIRQSAEPPRPPPRRAEGSFEVALVADAGRALTEEWRRRARAEQAANDRYRWLGEVSLARAKRSIAAARLLLLTSISEGGANVLGEAIVSGTPVVCDPHPGRGLRAGQRVSRSLPRRGHAGSGPAPHASRTGSCVPRAPRSAHEGPPPALRSFDGEKEGGRQQHAAALSMGVPTRGVAITTMVRSRTRSGCIFLVLISQGASRISVDHLIAARRAA
jgi:hypothetical protein